MAIRAALLAFYSASARDLPWRRTRDPFAIWVSEIMLQQTRVETVIPYFERFLATFPTVQALAEAPLERVLARWSGLGYYRRARLLHAGARAVVEAGGEPPKTFEELRAIPGVGRYTAGAIASIAHGQEVPAVDGNAERVLSRVLAESSRAKVEEAARRLVRGPSPGALNQALMELGSRICTPRSPRCGECPIAPQCRARATDRMSELPPPRVKSAVKRWSRVALVARDGDAVLLARRKRALVFGGLWEPPAIDGRGATKARELATLLGANKFERARSVRHLLSHRDVRVTVFESRGRFEPRAAPADYDAIEWLTELPAMSTLARKMLAG